MSNEWQGGQQPHPQSGQPPLPQGGQQPYPQGQHYPPTTQQPTTNVPLGQYPNQGQPPGYGGGPGGGGPGDSGGPGNVGGPGNGEGRGKRFLLIAALLVTVTGLLVGGGLVLVNRGNDTAAISDGEATYVIVDAPAANVTPVFQPRDARGPDPFFALEVQQVTFLREQMDEAIVQVQAQGGDASDVDPADFQVERLSEQTKTGLYGGTAENTCDPERLITFLLENPYLGQAWAQVQGISFAEIPSYIRSLEVRVLAAPVEVLNHGFNEITGQAYEIDSTLDAGTAVLVDAEGAVRTRCYCGNPIRPKPPTGPKPPACLVIPLQVYAAPDSGIRRLGSPSTVFTTGRTATYEGRTWSEVMWGSQTNKMGWTLRNNMQPKVYCRPVTPPPGCPAGNGATVYRTASGTEELGSLGVPAGSFGGGGRLVPVSATAGGEQVIVDSRILVHFGHPIQKVMAGWINVSEVDFAGDPYRCEPIRACVDFSVAPTKPGSRGPIAGVTAGTQRVEITGRISPQPGPTAGTSLTAFEVKLLERGGQRAWAIAEEATLLADDECDAPTTLCKASGVEIGQDILWSSATASLPFPDFPDDGEPPLTDDQANAMIAEFVMQDFSVVRGYAGSVDVTLVGSTVPTNGRLEVQVGSGGPIGWIDASTLTGGYCTPHEVCLTISSGVFSNYRDAGSILPGTPATQTTVKIWPAAALNFEAGAGPGIGFGPGGLDLDEIYLHIEVGGARGWVPIANLLTDFPGDCTPPPPPACPPGSVAPETNGLNCCVTYEGASYIVALSGRQATASDLTFYEVGTEDGKVFWVETADFVPADQCTDVPVSCPILPAGPAQTGEAELVCCAALDNGESLSFVEVTLTGDAGQDAGGMTTYQTSGNGTITQGDFVSAQFCNEPPPETPGCDQGLTELLPGVCCASGQEILNGQCADPCPQGQVRNNAGTCFTPCPTGQQRAADGSCFTPCPTGQQRATDGTCFTPCPTGQQRTTGGVCYTPCPDGSQPTGEGCPDTETFCPEGQVRVEGDRCCPTGTELVANQCTSPCPEGQIRDANGACQFDCPEGQITLLRQCCPSNTRPTGDGACSVPCPTQIDRLGTCCPSGQTIDSQTELCNNPCPPNLQLGNGGCCAEGEEVANGECYTECATVRDSFGECCASGQVDTGTGLCRPACPAGTTANANNECVRECPSGVVAPADNECCRSGEVIDPGGFCNDPCDGTFNTQTGGCCPSGTEPFGDTCAGLCPSDSDRDILGSCCPVRSSSTPAIIDGEGICQFSA